LKKITPTELFYLALLPIDANIYEAEHGLRYTGIKLSGLYPNEIQHDLYEKFMPFRVMYNYYANKGYNSYSEMLLYARTPNKWIKKLYSGISEDLIFMNSRHVVDSIKFFDERQQKILLCEAVLKEAFPDDTIVDVRSNLILIAYKNLKITIDAFNYHSSEKFNFEITGSPEEHGLYL
jgi:hypothetical protein